MPFDWVENVETVKSVVFTSTQTQASTKKLSERRKFSFFDQNLNSKKNILEIFSSFLLLIASIILPSASGMWIYGALRCLFTKSLLQVFFTISQIATNGTSTKGNLLFWPYWGNGCNGVFPIRLLWDSFQNFSVDWEQRLEFSEAGVITRNAISDKNWFFGKKMTVSRVFYDSSNRMQSSEAAPAKSLLM